MFLLVMGGLMGVSVVLAGWKFYGSIDWEEPPEPSPDLRAMHKKEAELLHIQDVLEEAVSQKKISPPVIEEFKRYCEAEIQGMRAMERAWRDRREKNLTPEGEGNE